MKKIYGISAMRVVALFTVVFYHSLCMYCIWHVKDHHPIKLYGHAAGFLSSIRMPVFIFISGFLYSHI